MLSLLLCTALWQSDASTLADEAALAAPQPKEFPVTRDLRAARQQCESVLPIRWAMHFWRANPL